MTGGRNPTELVTEVEKVFTGKREVVELAVVTLLAGGHLLLEDVPGVGKTTLARTLARAIDCRFGRIQFTSDMLPSDVIGTNVFHPSTGQFQFRAGPVFANVVLADEINRTSPRTQSALLEAMNERQVSVDGETHRLDDPFFVIATQNPKELHGTYPLPESQLDRFLLSLSIGYPDPAVESQVILGMNDEEQMHRVEPVLDREGLAALRRKVRNVQARQELGNYIQRILAGSREPDRFELGASPRAGIQLLKAARAAALLRGRDFVTPDDIRWVAPYVLSHRLVVKNAGHLAGGRAAALARVEEMLESIQVP
ncbi:MAG: MoxR family ATPase [Deltaproteobacteria bacterium]|nr:MoxR family ATPase [Deltaproteobacteria bacterium]